MTSKSARSSQKIGWLYFDVCAGDVVEVVEVAGLEVELVVEPLPVPGMHWTNEHQYRNALQLDSRKRYLTCE